MSKFNAKQKAALILQGLFAGGHMIDFARFNDKDYEYEEINNIQIPLFLRWADNDLVIQNLDELIEELKQKIKNDKLNIGYICDELEASKINAAKEALFIKEKFPEYQGIIESKIYDIETSMVY